MSLICRGTEARSVYDNHLDAREKAIEKTTCGVNLLTLICVYWSLLFDNVNEIPPRQIVVPRYAVDNATLVFSPMPFHVKDYMIVNYLIFHPSLPNSIYHQMKNRRSGRIRCCNYLASARIPKVSSKITKRDFNAPPVYSVSRYRDGSTRQCKPDEKTAPGMHGIRLSGCVCLTGGYFVAW